MGFTMYDGHAATRRARSAYACLCNFKRPGPYIIGVTYAWSAGRIMARGERL